MYASIDRILPSPHGKDHRPAFKARVRVAESSERPNPTGQIHRPLPSYIPVPRKYISRRPFKPRLFDPDSEAVAGPSQTPAEIDTTVRYLSPSMFSTHRHLLHQSAAPEFKTLKGAELDDWFEKGRALMLKTDFRAQTNLVIHSTPRPPPPTIVSPFRVDTRKMTEGWGWEGNGTARRNNSEHPEAEPASQRPKGSARRGRRQKFAAVNALNLIRE